MVMSCGKQSWVARVVIVQEMPLSLPASSLLFAPSFTVHGFPVSSIPLFPLTPFFFALALIFYSGFDAGDGLYGPPRCRRGRDMVLRLVGCKGCDGLRQEAGQIRRGCVYGTYCGLGRRLGTLDQLG